MSSYYKAFTKPTFTHPTTGVRMPDNTGWQSNHTRALRLPMGFERPIVHLLCGWAEYADQWRAQYDTPIAEDSYAGDHFLTIARAIRALLNCETGRLDCGTLDGFICDTLRAEGFSI